MRRAFTLVEIMVIMVVMALLSAAVLPHYSAYLKSQRVHAFTTDFVSLFAEAKSDTSVGRTTKVTIDQSGNLAIVQNDENGDEQTLKTLAVPDGIHLDGLQLNDNTVAESDWKVGFYTDGKSDRAMISLTEGSSSNQYRILSTGRVVKVNEGDDDPEQKWEAGQLVQQTTG